MASRRTWASCEHGERVSASRRPNLATHQIRQAGIEVLQVIRVDVLFRIVLHPQAHLAETVGPNKGIPIAVTMHKEPVASSAGCL